ncbi:HAD-IB family phosphatase [Vibrio parahaemolyticus]|nr:HAD-IB family phosphatase [Vibrio parahaemolyticus]EHK0037277.1 HAD-IB family phosphatase [Vibrio parahaemolyticus]
MNIVIFDFCETLVDLQTADDYVHFVLKNDGDLKGMLKFKLYKSLFYRVLVKLGFVCSPKLPILKLLKGKKYEKLDKYGKEYIEYITREKSNININKALKDAKLDGASIFIISGGYDIYIKHFLPDYIDLLICTELDFRNQIFSGEIKGLDCLGLHKLKKLYDKFPKHDFVRAKTSFYTDHISDLPLLEIVDKPFVVTSHRDLTWALSNKFEIVEK